MTREDLLLFIFLAAIIAAVFCSVMIGRLTKGYTLWTHVIDRGYEISKYVLFMYVANWFATSCVILSVRMETSERYMPMSFVYAGIMTLILAIGSWFIGRRSAKAQLRESRASADE
jgi:hypothetical protein